MAAGVKLSTFLGLRDVYFYHVMLMKCQNKQLVLNLTAKGTAGESSPRHHLAHTQSLDKTLGTPHPKLNRSERGGEVTDWLEPKTGGAGCRGERADRHGAGRRDRAPAAAEPGAASRLERHRRRAGAASSGADYN